MMATHTNLQVQDKTALRSATSFTPVRSGILQRKCACGGSPGVGEECAECRSKRLALQRQSAGQTGFSPVPSIVHDVLRSPGQPLDAATQAFMEPRFGHDFSKVRVHTDGKAAESARAVNALAYTVGKDVVFGAGQYAPKTSEGRRLLSHELTHTVQQVGSLPGFDQHQRQFSFGNIYIIDDSYEQEAERMALQVGSTCAVQPLSTQVRQRIPIPILSRANLSTTTAVLRRGTVVGSGIQFYPTQVSSTRVGPVSGTGGLVGDIRSHRLSVIIGQGMTLRALARLVLPLWETAAPFIPPGSTVPLSEAPLSETILARGLLVYNQYYLPVPAMTQWKAGLRFPLPIDIDLTTNEGVLNLRLIRNLANSFNTEWERLLDQPAPMPAAPIVTDLRQSVATFMASEPTASARGIGLSTRAITNALEGRPFVLEAFNQLGTNAFDVALEFMDASINQQIALLASQRAGADILNRLRAILAAPPTTLSSRQRTSLDRANLMLGKVAAIVPREVPINTACPKGYKDLGKFLLTAYVLAQEKDFPKEPTVTDPCGLKGKFREAFLFKTSKSPRGVKVQGSGESLSGKIIHYAGKKDGKDCFEVLDKVKTSTGTEATSGRTVAVDFKVIPRKSEVLIEDIGTRVAEDTGGHIKGKHIDIYYGTDMSVQEANRRTLRDKKVCMKVLKEE